MHRTRDQRRRRHHENNVFCEAINFQLRVRPPFAAVNRLKVRQIEGYFRIKSVFILWKKEAEKLIEGLLNKYFFLKEGDDVAAKLFQLNQNLKKKNPQEFLSGEALVRVQ